MGATSLACTAWTAINDPAANPHRDEFALALVFLLTAFIMWRSMQPTPRLLLRCCAVAGGAVAFLEMQALVCTEFNVADRGEASRLVLDASLLVAATLFLEMLLSGPHDGSLARAVARVRSRRRS